jgi:DNA-binding XRE family transcriptional regulator
MLLQLNENHLSNLLPKWPIHAIFSNTMPDFGINNRALELASRFRTERKGRKMTIAEFAERAGINPRTYSHFEQTGEISLERLIRALIVLGRAEEIETLVRPSTSFSSLDEMEARLRSEQGVRSR